MRFGDTCYRLILLAFPPDFRRRYGGSMVGQFRRQRHALRGRPLALVALWIRAVIDGVGRGLGLRVERRAASLRGWSVPRAGRVVWIDAGQALRFLRRQPRFALGVGLTLAIGISTTVAAFHVAYAVLLEPLPYAEPAELLVVTSRTDEDQDALAKAELQDLRTLPLLTSGAWNDSEVYFVGGVEPQWVQAASVTPNLFPMLGVPPVLGRHFREGEERTDSPVAILAHDLWLRQFAADPSVVGTAVQFNGTALTVVGVMPAGFRLPGHLDVDNPAEVWRPMTVTAENLSSRPVKELSVVARLASGRSLAEARVALDDLSRRLRAEFPDDYASEPPWRFVAEPLSAALSTDLRAGVWLLVGVASCLLVLVTVSASTLVLVRGLARQAELQVRLALGAGRSRVGRQVLFEGVVLGAVAGAAGFGLAWVMLDAVFPLVTQPVVRAQPEDVGLAVPLFAAALSVTIGLAVGLAAAAQVRRAGPAAWNSTRATVGVEYRRPLAGLLMTEVALSLVLATGAGLMGGSLWRLYRVDPGLRTDDVLAIDVRLPRTTHPTADDTTHFFRQAVAAIDVLPSVDRAGAVRRLPLGSRIGRWSLRLSRADAAATGLPEFQVVTPGYFETLGIPVRAGRTVAETDRADRPGVVVVNQAMAAEFWPGQDAVGQELRMDGHPDNPWVRVVGVVGDVRSALRADPAARVYLPHAQAVTIAGPFMRTPSLTLLAHGEADVETLAEQIRDAVRGIDPRVPLGEVRTMTGVVARSLATPRLLAAMFAIFGAVALLLTATGLFGAFALAVRQRTREIGIRLAIGARPAQVCTIMLRRAAFLITGGVTFGAVLAIWLAPALQVFVFDVAPRDGWTLLAAAVAVAVIAIPAGLLPARQAMRTDPVAALRDN